MPHAPRRRTAFLLLVPVVVAVGLVVTGAVGGLAGDLLGGVLYAALVYVLLGAVRPAWRAPVLAGVAFGVCAAIELAQLTGLPAQVVGEFSLARYVLGSTFTAHDLPAYAVGALLSGAIDRWGATRAVASGTLRT